MSRTSYDGAVKRSADLVSETPGQTDGTEIVLPDVKVGHFSERGDPVCSGSNQGCRLASSTVGSISGLRAVIKVQYLLD